MPLTALAPAGLVDPPLAVGDFSDLKHPDPSDRLSAQANVTVTSLFSDITFTLHFTLTGHSS